MKTPTGSTTSKLPASIASVGNCRKLCMTCSRSSTIRWDQVFLGFWINIWSKYRVREGQSGTCTWTTWACFDTTQEMTRSNRRRRWWFERSIRCGSFENNSKNMWCTFLAFAFWSMGSWYRPTRLHQKRIDPEWRHSTCLSYWKAKYILWQLHPVRHEKNGQRRQRTCHPLNCSDFRIFVRAWLFKRRMIWRREYTNASRRTWQQGLLTADFHRSLDDRLNALMSAEVEENSVKVCI